MNGVELIAAERARQIHVEGYDQNHDNDHDMGELAKVAAVLAVHHTDCLVDPGASDPDMNAFDDPWGLISKHGGQSTPETIRRLTIAGALIAAEIDRLHRLETLGEPATQKGDGPACAPTHPAPAESPRVSSPQDSRQ